MLQSGVNYLDSADVSGIVEKIVTIMKLSLNDRYKLSDYASADWAWMRRQFLHSEK